MSNQAPTEMQCPQCGQMFRDGQTVALHLEQAHRQTWQQTQERAARSDQRQMAAQQRQQDMAGRRETAGQPGGEERGNQGRHPQEANREPTGEPAAPGQPVQQTQQQQRQVEEAGGDRPDAKEPRMQYPEAGREGRAEHSADAGSAENAVQEAGWARLTSPDGRLDLGRGRLQVWYEAPGSPQGVRHARLSSYAPGAIEARRGDAVVVCPEGEAEGYPATVAAYEPVPAGEGVVVLDWPNDALPASLRELGGK